MTDQQQDTSWGYVVISRGRDPHSSGPARIVGWEIYCSRRDAERERSLCERTSEIRYPGEREYLIGKIVGADD